MADNTTLDAGSGGDVIASDDIGGIKFQRIKLIVGADGTNDGDVASGNPLPVSDAGGSLTVDGTVTANLSATDNAVLDTIDAVLDTINAKLVTGTVIGDVNLGATDNAVLDSIVSGQLADGHNVTVDNASLTVDLGANNDVTVTSGTITANLSATDNAVLDNIQTAVELIDNAISGSEMQVDIVAALPAGTNEIGKLAAGSAVIGEVTIGAATGAAGDLAKAEDAVHASGDIGVMSLAVRNDTLAALAGTDGDYAPLQVDASGALFVNVQSGAVQGYAEDSVHSSGDEGIMSMAVRNDSLAALAGADGDYAPLQVDASGSLYVTGGGGGTEYTEDVATANPIVGTATVMERDDALSTLTLIAGDWAAMRCSAEGALWTQEFNSDAILSDTASMDTNLGTVAGAVSGSEMQVDIVSGTVTANLSATDNAVLDTIDAVLDTINAKLVTGTVIGDVNLGATDNAVLDSIVTNTTGLAGTVSGSELQCDVLTLPNVTLAAGTNTNEVVGDVAHDAAAAGNPVLIAARATASVEGITEVAEADSTFLAADLSGAVITRAACAHAELVSFYIANTDGAEDAVTSLDDGGAAIYNFITSVTIHNAHATTNGFVTLLDGSGGSIFWLFPAPALGGTTHNFDPPLRQPTISTALYVDVNAAITTMHISINGYQGNG